MKDDATRAMRKPATQIEEAERPALNPTANRTMGDVIAARFSRRGFLQGAMAVTAIGATVSPMAMSAAGQAQAQSASGPTFDFTELAAGVDRDHHVAEGYNANVLMRWGDPVTQGAPEFDVQNQTPEAQAQQFGYNNDFVGYIPIDGSSTHGLLVVNHEYTNEALMFPGIASVTNGELEVAPADKRRVDLEMAATGGSIVEIRKNGDTWAPVDGASRNRRITANTPMQVTGPAAGHERLQTNADPTGREVLGTINNCAGGVTPWGTYIMAEENFHGYFQGELEDGHPEAASYERYGMPGGWWTWGDFYDRFDIGSDPHEANRFGWIVEVDVEDPQSTPKKRTALGRFRHEGAENALAPDGRLVVYMGDDNRFDYIYKFVTAGTYNPDDRAANMDLLDDGTLYVARFNDDGTLDWLPLVHGEGELTSENGFESQADVLIDTRLAADAVGATPMDRPEGFEPNPTDGRVYLNLTSNDEREEANPVNPRTQNEFGHIVELIEPDGDFASTTSNWEILVQCGNPALADVGATFSSETSDDGWFINPDNVSVDAAGRLWIATDGNGPDASGRTDGLWAMETRGDLRGTSKLFYRVPVGAEMCGPRSTPDNTTFFLAIQHPGDGGEDWAEFGRPSYFEDPVTRWPDFADGMPPRPSVVAITRQGGGQIA